MIKSKLVAKASKELDEQVEKELKAFGKAEVDVCDKCLAIKESCTCENTREHDSGGSATDDRESIE